ncbi:MAG: GGDEF domain-containing protein [Acidobacteriota bacterium]|nr:GGDEF domain-containing protein [Acidobacteriota bacterium]
MHGTLGADAGKSSGTEYAPVRMAPGLVGRHARKVMMVMVTFIAMGICGFHATVASANTERSAGYGYLCLALVLVGCGAGFWTRAIHAHGTLKIRWSLTTAAALITSLGYLAAFSELVLRTAPSRNLQTACFNTGEVLYLLSALLFFSRVSRAIVIVDMLQAALFVILRFDLIYSPTMNRFNLDRLIIGQVIALCLLVVASVACLGAATRGELKFLRILSCFLGIRLIAYFLANQVSYAWMHFTNGSELDVAGTVLLAGFALYLFYMNHSTLDAMRDADVERTPSVVVRSLMPSFLALLDVLLGLILLHNSPLLAGIAIGAALLCYVVRAVLLDVLATEERTALKIYNKQLEGLATCDPLTGIGNRRSFAGAFSRLQATAGELPLSLMLIDIDHFKQANDRYGHLHGDQVLVTLAKKLERMARGFVGSNCARFGGDEFALLLVGVPPEQAAKLAEDLCQTLRTHEWEAEEAKESLSIGIASLHSVRDLPLEALISLADKALYRAKLAGRDRAESQPVWGAGTMREGADVPLLSMELRQMA